MPFNQWLDGVMTPDRTIDFLPTGQGDYLGNSFAATYSTSGGGGQIPTVVNLNGPTATTQYLAAKAYMAAKSYACVLYDNLLYSAQGDWTRSDYETSFLANASGVKDSANNIWLIPINQPGIPLAFVATVLDSVGRPVPNVQVAFWWDTPTITSSSLGFTLYRLSSDVYQEIDLGDFAHPFIRTSDANGNAVLNVLPLLLNNVTGDIVAFLGATYGGIGTETSACLIPLFSQGCGPDVNTRLPFTRNRSNTGFGCPSITDGGFYYCLTRPPVSGDGNGTVYDLTNPIQDQQLALLSAAVVGSPLVRTAGRLTVYTKLAAKSP